MLEQDLSVLVAEVFERRDLDHPPNSRPGQGVAVVDRRHSDIVSTATGQGDLPNFGTHVARFRA